MKKIISLILVLINVVFISTSFAGVNQDQIPDSDLVIISKGSKSVNNMKCDYIEVGYDDYQTMTFEDGIEQKRNIDLNKIKLSNIEDFNFNDREDVKEALKKEQEKYSGNSYSIDIFIPSKMSGYSSIYKDGKYIYNALDSKYYKNGTFGFTHNAYNRVGNSGFGTYFIFSNCKEIITNSYQTSLNKNLKNNFDKINEKFKDDEENRNAFYNNLNIKIDKLLKTTLSLKNKFIVEYIKEASLYYQQNKDGYLQLVDDKIENIGYTDFVN